MSDLISRQKAIQKIKELPNSPNGYSATYDKASIIMAIEDVEPAGFVHAHWKPSKEPKHEKEFSRFFVCTNCSHDIQLRHAGIVEDIGFEYCPHCGAKMDKVVS